MKLLLRLYDVDDGTITINGRSIKEYDVHQMRSRIGVAFQNTNIYAMSFAENMSLYQHLSEEDLRKTAKKLGLDEPSSALDPPAEYKLSQAILGTANRTTTIMIAHRLSTVRDADGIVVMSHGQICESGKHDELMDAKGVYYEMFTKQAENYVKE